MTLRPPAFGTCRAIMVRWRLLLLLLSASGRLAAHPAHMTSAAVNIQRNGQFHLAVRFDTLAFALNDSSERMPDEPMNALLDGPRAVLERRMNEAYGHFARHFQLMANGRAVAITGLRCT